jgi:hypothetical protein
MALFMILGINWTHLPAEADHLKRQCRVLWEQYRTGKLTCGSIVDIMQDLGITFELSLQSEVVSDPHWNEKS